LDESLQKYSCHQLAISFNGGKDSVVMLHLIDMALQMKQEQVGGHQLFASTSTPAEQRNSTSLPSCGEAYSMSKMVTLYFLLDNIFQEVTDYVGKAAKRYKLCLITLGEFKLGLEKVKAEYPVQAIFMGTRKIDPHGETLQPFQPTDPGWPQFMRINPILDWKYHEVWAFIQYFNLEYCSLYDQGYTSIGQQHNTRPNPALAYRDDITGVLKYLPAYKLQDGTKEREGRGVAVIGDANVGSGGEARLTV